MNKLLLLSENVAIAVAVTVATMLVDFDPQKIADYRTWGIGVLAAVVRTAAATLLATLNTVRQVYRAAR